MGHGVAKHPKKSILVAILICIITSLGNLCWYEELDEVELFMPKDSPVRKNFYWVRENFPDDIRFESIIIAADNIIRPDIFQSIWEIEQDIKAINVSGLGWEDMCAGFKSLFPEQANNSNNSSEDSESLLKDVDNSCLYQSILKPWTTVNETDFHTMNSQLLLKNFTTQLGKRGLSALDNMKLMVSGIVRERSINKTAGLVKSAKATILTFMLKKDHPLALEWELEFIQKTLHSKHNFPPDMKIYAVATRSYKDTLQSVLNNNLTIFFAGFSLIILYVIIMLSRFNMIQHRVYLSLVAVAVVGMSISSSFGTCFFLGLSWGPIHPILPFLLLGIGVDNTFVITQCLDNIRSSSRDTSVQERIGKALQQAGVSISITSLTDILAFAVGTSSSMPFLRSFCIFAWTGILFLYFYVNVLLVGSLSLDEHRIEDRRDGFCCRRREWKPNPCSSRNIQRDFFAQYFAPFLVRPTVKVLVIFITLSIFAVNTYCIFLVEQKFDPNWYLNTDSYPIQFNDKLNEYFPRYGKRSAIFLGGIDYLNEKPKLDELMNQLEANPYINSDTLEFWFSSFHAWMARRRFEPEDDEEFRAYLTEFLISENGQHFLNDMKFSAVPVGEYQIMATRIPIQHLMMNSTSEQSKTMASMNEIIKNSNLTSNTATLVSFSPEYVSWTANQIIGQELIRNLCITLGAVGTVTLILIRNVRIAIIVFLCVIFTVIDLVGSLYWLGLTIEISTSILSILCAGLAVDYAAHIGYEFTRVTGTRNERSIKTVSLLGAAVFNGGFSTFLAFVLLSGSNSYLFTTFFKLFTGVVTFGVWHGLVFLPVILSICGPLINNTEQKSTVYVYQNGHYDASRNKDGNSSPTLISDKDVHIERNIHQISRLLDNNPPETNDTNNKDLISIHVISDLKNQNISPNQQKRNHSLEENNVHLEAHENENS